jgi:hypothetical protein
MSFGIKPLDTTTWSDFARLAGDHHGVWEGCWCLGFHEEGAPHIHTPEQRRALKETRVREGRAHAALVFDGERCVGWCQFGTTDELPRIKSTHRHRGVADAGLGGALAEISRLGGGTVESYPEDTAGRKVSGSFLNNGTVAMFERHGFARVRRIGKHRWVVTRVVG